MKKYVLGFIVCLESNEVLLIEKKKPLWQEGYLNGIGGKIEDTDKTGLAAMMREAKEECGLLIPVSYWNWFATMTSDYWEVKCYITIVPHLIFKSAETKEAEKVVVVNLANLLSNQRLLGNISWLVTMGLDAEFNKNSFDPPVIWYNDYSFPLAMEVEEKQRRIAAEKENEIK